MKTSRRTFYALAMAVGCALAAPSFGDDFAADSYQSQVVFRPPLIQQTSAQQPTGQVEPTETTEAEPASPIPVAPGQVPTSRWDRQEPIQTPEQEAVAASGGQYVACPTCYGPGCQFIAGIEATFFWPQFSRTFLNTGFQNDLGTVNIVNNAALGSADGGFLVAPRITLGVQGECWGLVGRYWNASNWANGFVPAVPGAVESGVILFDNFRAYTVDLEVQRRFCWRHWDMFGFLGSLRLGQQRPLSMDAKLLRWSDPGAVCVCWPAIQRRGPDAWSIWLASAVLRQRSVEGLLFKSLLGLVGQWSCRDGDVGSSH